MLFWNYDVDHEESFQIHPDSFQLGDEQSEEASLSHETCDPKNGQERKLKTQVEKLAGVYR